MSRRPRFRLAIAASLLLAVGGTVATLPRMDGILVYQQIKSLLEQGHLTSNPAIAPTQVQPASLDLRLSSNYKTRWYGISFAAHVAKHVAVGLSGFLADQGGNYNEDIGLASGGTFNDSGVRIDGNSATSQHKTAS